MSDRSTEERIHRAAAKKEGYAYFMLRAFFLVKERDGEVRREAMQRAFNELLGHGNAPDCLTPFLMAFRQMSSPSFPVFEPGSSSSDDLILLRPEAERIALSLEDEFNA